jgi:peptidoglycan/LPS O-acetylase OafA/YrhL
VKQSGKIQPLLFLGWTLNYEMFFYSALAVGLLISRRRAAWVGSGIVLAVMLGCIPFASYSVLARFYSEPIVIDLVLGVVCYYLCRAILAEYAAVAPHLRLFAMQQIRQHVHVTHRRRRTAHRVHDALAILRLLRSTGFSKQLYPADH